MSAGLHALRCIRPKRLEISMRMLTPDHLRLRQALFDRSMMSGIASARFRA
jgi:hypothetical protein